MKLAFLEKNFFLTKNVPKNKFFIFIVISIKTFLDLFRIYLFTILISKLLND